MMVFAHIRENFAAAFFPRLSEWLAGFVLLGLGWMLSANPELMQSGKTDYQLMLMIASQPFWSSVLIVFAAGRLAVLLINGAWRRSPHLRALAAFLSCFFWTQITLSFAPNFGFAVVLACGWLGMDMINIMRAMRDARTIDDTYRRGIAGGNA
ncbi:hypothetical protein B5K11_09830 [Rhizobium leguminosarum bv. trifolii]|uniref:hypothetical protein n=1 Tax=Rhizobium leguminosarum TaxID=384 RepID=UPI000E2FCA08|nr:hypothetical protein [Rhizobium leguminosarum]RFB95238.1 hypothetical protein B5K11_09830 [Rhizobium leguminosarum bv. trifolii]